MKVNFQFSIERISKPIAEKLWIMTRIEQVIDIERTENIVAVVTDEEHVRMLF